MSRIEGHGALDGAHLWEIMDVAVYGAASLSEEGVSSYEGIIITCPECGEKHCFPDQIALYLLRAIVDTAEKRGWRERPEEWEHRGPQAG